MENNKRPNQVSKVLSYMREHGSITSREAFYELSIQSLPKRICEIEKMGFIVRRVREIGINKLGEKVRSNRYFLVEEPKEVVQ